jgi:hypothetical protein
MKRTPSRPLRSPLPAAHLLLFCLTACVADGTKEWQPVLPRQDFHEHLVAWPGETLAMIAQWYTGSKDNWKKIANANPNIVAEHLAPGDRILLPPDLLRTTKKMPRDFLATFAGKGQAGQEKTPARAMPAPEKKDEFQPYGPK